MTLQMKNLSIIIPFIFFSSVSFSQSERIKANFEHGDIVSSTTGRTGDGVMDRCSEAYSAYMAGVFNEKTETRNIPVIIETGIALVKFDDSNGAVAKGSFVTSSALPGYSMKAEQSGFVLGVALEDSKGTGLLKIRVQMGWEKL